jgi:glyoxylase-like metal-dependent hydrolase (beta-lactamase superfamily II)
MEQRMQIIDGIYQFQVPIPNNPLGVVNVHLLKSRGQNLLVDTGWNTPVAYDALVNQLAECDLAVTDLQTILITHIHPDHYGLAGRLARESGAQVLMHPAEADMLELRYTHAEEMVDVMDAFFLAYGSPDMEREKFKRVSMSMLDVVSAVMPDRLVNDGDHLQVGDFDVELYWTPGHAPGHLCAYLPQQQIFISGDHVLPRISPNISLHPQSGPNPLGDYLASLRRVENLPVEWVLPSHGQPFKDLRGRVAEIAAHHMERKQILLDALRVRELNAFEAAAKIPWRTNGVAWADLPLLTQRGAMLEALAHIELLHHEGLVTRHEHDGRITYTAAA